MKVKSMLPQEKVIRIQGISDSQKQPASPKDLLVLVATALESNTDLRTGGNKSTTEPKDIETLDF